MKQKEGNTTHINELIAACENGTLRSKERLYKHFYSYAMSISRLYTYSNDDAVSILNDGFLKVFAALDKGRYDIKTPFKYWLRRIIINTAIDSYRKNLKHYHHLDIEEMDHLQTGSDHMEGLTFQDFMKLLDQLPELHRLVFNMYEIQGYKHDEIAKKLGIETSSSRVFLTRAKKKLRVLYNQNF